MSYEEEDTCMSYEEGDTCMSHEEEDTCMSYEEEDTCVKEFGHLLSKRAKSSLPPPPPPLLVRDRSFAMSVISVDDGYNAGIMEQCQGSLRGD